MATYGTRVRRGLPRLAGGEPWPPAGEAPIEVAVVADAVAAESVDPAPAVAEPTTPVAEPTTPVVEPTTPVAEPVEASSPSHDPSTSSGSGSAASIRRGLPRVPGGEPWPPASVTPASGPTTPVAEPVAASSPAHDPSTSSGTATVASGAGAVAPGAGSVAPAAGAVAAAASSTPLRRGLPRTAGGDPWPPAGFAPNPVAEPVEASSPTHDPSTSSGTGGAQEAASVAAPAAASVVAVPEGPRPPLPFTRTVFPGASARVFERQRRAGGPVITAPEPERIGPFTKLQWAGAVIVGGAGLLVAAFLAVVAVRFLLSTEPLRDFLTTYPGEYHLPEGAPVGFPAWLGWQHFFNVFLMILIIRSGLQVRNEKRPTAFWAPKNNPKGKISLALWFHQSLDILWLVNGVIFVVLLFVSGQWMRVIPTSWEVFPNALSAVLQYISLDWPTENGWVNYNSVQQLAYFTTIFIAAPVAAITGARMTKLWPQNAKTLNRIYPIEWARAVHFPTMIYFCLFIFVHVVLVFATGALRNLNHMYAAQGSVDPNAYADNWAGFWIFFASMVVIAGAWIAARPLVLAPIARLFGNVSGR